MMAEVAGLSYKRYEKSLGLLTTRFVTLLQKAKDGVLDLRSVSKKTLSWEIFNSLRINPHIF